MEIEYMSDEETKMIVKRRYISWILKQDIDLDSVDIEKLAEYTASFLVDGIFENPSPDHM